MAKDPAFLFYTNDFSTGTQFFTDEQLGKYLRLLMAQHQHGHLSEKQMMHICKSYDKEVFIKFIKDDNGMFFNERLEVEIFKRKNFTNSRSNNKSGRKPSKTDNLNKEPIITKESYDLHMEDVNRNINKDEDIRNVCLKILDDFGFSETRDFNKLSKISESIRFIISSGDMDYFKEQYQPYFEFKKQSGQQTQSIETFFDWLNKYENPGWKRENWIKKLATVNNGTKQKPNLDNIAGLANAILADHQAKGGFGSTDK